MNWSSYDLDRNRVHRLNRTTAEVWRLCDGQRTVTDIAAQLGRHVNAVEIEPIVSDSRSDQLGAGSTARAVAPEISARRANSRGARRSHSAWPEPRLSCCLAVNRSPRRRRRRAWRPQRSGYDSLHRWKSVLQSLRM